MCACLVSLQCGSRLLTFDESVNGQCIVDVDEEGDFSFSRCILDLNSNELRDETLVSLEFFTRFQVVIIHFAAVVVQVRIEQNQGESTKKLGQFVSCSKLMFKNPTKPYVVNTLGIQTPH